MTAFVRRWKRGTYVNSVGSLPCFHVRIAGSLPCFCTIHSKQVTRQNQELCIDQSTYSIQMSYALNLKLLEVFSSLALNATATSHKTTLYVHVPKVCTLGIKSLNGSFMPQPLHVDLLTRTTDPTKYFLLCTLTRFQRQSARMWLGHFGRWAPPT